MAGCSPGGNTRPISQHPQSILFSEYPGFPIWLYFFIREPPHVLTQEGLASLFAEGCPLFQIELLDTVALNLHRIDKDVQRCDRNYWYFTPPNLERLRDIMCRYQPWGGRLRVGDRNSLLLCERFCSGQGCSSVAQVPVRQKKHSRRHPAVHAVTHSTLSR